MGIGSHFSKPGSKLGYLSSEMLSKDSLEWHDKRAEDTDISERDSLTNKIVIGLKATVDSSSSILYTLDSSIEMGFMVRLVTEKLF